MKRSKKQGPPKSKMVTGYIIYASEIRKEIIKKNPEKDFGGISKIVGLEWKNLSQESKVAYEKRAQEQNSQSKITFASEAALELSKLADVAATRAANEEKEQQQQLLHPQQQVPRDLDPSQLLIVQPQHQQQPQQQQQHQQFQLIQHQQQLLAPMPQYCSNPFCGCSSARYQPYPYPYSPPEQSSSPTGTTFAQQQHQQQPPQPHQSLQQVSGEASPAHLLLAQQQPSHQQPSQQPPPQQPQPQSQQQQQQHQQQLTQQRSPQQAQQQEQQQQPASRESSPNPNLLLTQHQTASQLNIMSQDQQPVTSMIQYCNNPACCCPNSRYQPYPYPYAPPARSAPPTSFSQQPQQQQPQQQSQQQQQQQQNGSCGHSPSHALFPYKRANVIYRKPALMRARPKDVATQTDPIVWVEGAKEEKKPLQFSQKFIDYINSSPNKNSNAAECH